MTELVSGIKSRFGSAPTLSATTPGGLNVVLRTPRFRDADSWRRVRMLNQAEIEPVWGYSDLSWPDRHRRRDWIRECIDARKRLRAGSCVHTVVEVDGELAGQCDAWLERYHKRGEIGVWIDSRWTGQRVGTTALGLLVDYLFAEVGLERVTAPIALGNIPIVQLTKRLGFAHEGLMRSYLEVGKGRCDHDLYSQTREEWIAHDGAR
ncbi:MULTISPECIES: GNAT family protein [unclassified Mycobacterium]|uniref:GNAT family N-acetyltransferase n=1 Tax=unclassified Mycobacterium TaxID=2642494 RepID=UPI0029C7A333|nr:MULTISPECIES: GNAT family protein [unclassified Mycobacterium]